MNTRSSSSPTNFDEPYAEEVGSSQSLRSEVNSSQGVSRPTDRIPARRARVNFKWFDNPPSWDDPEDGRQFTAQSAGQDGICATGSAGWYTFAVSSAPMTAEVRATQLGRRATRSRESLERFNMTHPASRRPAPVTTTMALAVLITLPGVAWAGHRGKGGQTVTAVAVPVQTQQVQLQYVASPVVAVTPVYVVRTPWFARRSES